jgi:carbamoyltransferase
MYVMGLNSLYHESCACVLADGQLVAAAEEERFSRIKHAKKPRVDNPHELPLEAMQSCLTMAGISLADVEAIGYSSDPRPLSRHPYARHFSFLKNTQRVPELLRVMGFGGRFVWIAHHAAHAASAYFPSPFADAAVLTLDGVGDDATTAWFHGHGNRLQQLRSVAQPSSLGFLWELVSMFLGFDIYDATKIMGLAAYGDPQRFTACFRQLIRLTPDGVFETNHDVLRFWKLDYGTPTGYFAGLERLLKLRHRMPGEGLAGEHRDVAAALQAVTDETVLHLAKHVHRATGAENLCLAGGVALNCLTNHHVFQYGPFARLFVQPAAHDAGTALGCAYHVWHHVLGREERCPMRDAYYGPEYSATEIERALQAAGLVYRRVVNVEEEAACRISQGAVVGFFQGRMEIGPRALGNRSLLADARNPQIREILNAKVKHREFFRPFAPSVLYEEAARWFRIEKETSAAEFMLMAYPVREHLWARIPAVIHVDGTSRIQAVRPEVNPRYHRLLSAFFRRTGVPLVLNTSFNDSEPIVCAPADAIETFLKTQIDELAIGDFLVSREQNRGVSRTTSTRESRALHTVFPSIHRQLDTALADRQVQGIAGLLIATDTAEHRAADRVPPLQPEHQWFLDEMVQEKMAGARVLELGTGSGVLALGAIRAGATQVVAVDRNPRARALAGWNAVLNRCEERLDLRSSGADLFGPLAGERFDYVIANVPFLAAAPDATSALYGMEFLAQLLGGIRPFLARDGHLQIVTLAAGDGQRPFVLLDLLRRTLPGRTVVRVHPSPAPFDRLVTWLWPNAGAASQEYLRNACHKGVSHVHLCMIHSDPSATSATTVERCKSWGDWHTLLPGSVSLKTPRPDAVGHATT